MSFPTTPLTVLVEAALGADLTADPGTWSWTDVTVYIYLRDRIAITRGKPDESATADSIQVTLTANNRDGRWSTRNPSGAWYGRIRKGTPMRVSVTNGVNTWRRAAGFLAELPPRWDVSGNDRYAPLTARGWLYRLSQGAAPVRSPLRRTLGASTALGYWSMEDALRATQFASGLIGGAPLTFAQASNINLAAIGTSPGSLPFAQFTAQSGYDNRASDITPLDLTALGVAVTKLSVSLVFSAFFAATPKPTQWRLFRTTTYGAGTFNDGPSLLIFAGYVGGARTGTYAVFASDGLGGTTSTGLSGGGFTGSNIDPFDGAAHSVMVTFEQVGADVVTTLIVDGTTFTSTNPAVTLRGSGMMYVPEPQGGTLDATAVDSTGSSIGIGHLAIWGAGTPTDPHSACIAYNGEPAHTRFLRLCDEENVNGTCAATYSQAMGPQAIDAVVPLLRDCEASDQGYLYEDTSFGLTLQSADERENMAVALSLDYTTAGHVAPPLEPTDDDKDARNDVEVQRDGGSSSRMIETSTSQELSTVNIGPRAESQTYSLYTDDQARQLAGWRLHTGTYPGYRFPVLTLNLVAAPSLIDAWCAAGLAFRATIANPPADIGPEIVDLIIDGYTETLGLFDWDVSANCDLNGPWKVSVLATTSGDSGAFIGWLDWDTCTLHANRDTTQTTWQIDASPVDTTAADDFPRDVYIGGELVTVTACSGGSAPQTWTVTRSVNGVVKAHTAGDVITLAHPVILAL